MLGPSLSFIRSNRWDRPFLRAGSLTLIFYQIIRDRSHSVNN